MNENYFDSIENVEDFLIAEKNGFSIAFKTNRPEMPGATIVHEAARKCNLELLEFFVNERNINLNQLDDDLCTPMGYILNDELVPEEITTVNLGCESLPKIIKTIEFFIKNNGICIYCEKQYSSNWVNYYLNELKEL